MIQRTFVAAMFAAGLALAPAAAQTGAASRSGGMEGLGGSAAGLLGGMLPGLGEAGATNVAGLLGYCVKTNALGGANAKTALGRLLGRGDVAADPAYEAGRNGQLTTPQGGAVSRDGVTGRLKTRMCAMVLQRARSFL